MLILSTIAAIVVTALAVIGLSTVVHTILDAVWTPRELTVAVMIPATAGFPAPELLDIWLSEAVRHPARRRGQAPVLLVAASLLAPDGQPDGESLAIIERYEAVLVPVEDACLE